LVSPQAARVETTVGRATAAVAPWRRNLRRLARDEAMISDIRRSLAEGIDAGSLPSSL
jgi:hypothetical protein